MFKWLGRTLDTPKSRAASRLCGITGWLSVIVLQFTAFFTQVPLPESYSLFLITCAALTGIEILEGVVEALKHENSGKSEKSNDRISEQHVPTYNEITGHLF